MASEDSDDVPHFRGKTLTPESPRPLHISEPANIPVLENQTDPVFNDTSTYEEILSAKDQAAANVASEVEDPTHLTRQLFSRTVELFRNDTNTFETKGTAAQNGNTSRESIVGSGSDASTLLPAETSTNATKKYTSSVSDARDLPVSNPTIDHFLSSDALHSPHTLPQADQYERTSSRVEPGSPALDPSAKYYDEDNNDGDNNETAHDRDSGVNFESLLDNLSQPPSATTSLTASTVPTTSLPFGGSSSSLLTNTSLSCPSGLPARPPSQEPPSIHPNYSSTGDIRSFHPVQAQAPTGYPQTHSNLHTHSTLSPVVESDAAVGEPSVPKDPTYVPPVAELQNQPHPSTFSAPSEPHQGEHQGDSAVKTSRLDVESDLQWGPDVQKKFEDFLREERKHVTDGLWDRFPVGSRLFVGNLPTEKVTKRDLFHLFHKYGNLAQVSIKQAYGFVQFVAASSCHNALEAEQGCTLRGRKIHLEISKPQRNTRHGRPAETHKAAAPGASKSPESNKERRRRGQGRHLSTDRYGGTQDAERTATTNDFRDRRRPGRHRRRGRDDYRPSRSPSPRGIRRDRHRSRDRSSERYDGRERRRSRSPYGRGDRHSSSLPVGRDREHEAQAEADLPIPKRAPRHVPDVQIIVLDEVDRQFIYNVERIFQDRGLRSDTLFLSPRIDISAVVHRQIVEGVLAIVKVSQSSQRSGKISLQVFDRSGGVNNVRFNEYSELDANVAGDVVLHARNIPSAGTSNLNNTVATPGGQLPSQQQVQSSMRLTAEPSNISSLISSLDGPSLHALLGSLQQQQQPPPPPHVPAAPAAIPQSNPAPPNLNSSHLVNFLRSASGTNPPIAPATIANNSTIPTHGFGSSVANTSTLATDQNLAALLANGFGNQAQNQPHQQNPQMHNIFNQLARWRQ